MSDTANRTEVHFDAHGVNKLQRGALHFDVTDLLSFLRMSRTVSGIQRVLIYVIRALHDSSTQDHPTYCVFYGSDDRWRRLDAALLVNLVDNAGRKDISWHDIYERFIRQAITGGQISFNAKDIIYFLDASWLNSRQFDSIRDHSENRPRCVFFIHDMIPLKFPEYFVADLAGEFAYWMHFVTTYSDAVICNSKATRDDFVAMTDYDRPVVVVNLNAKPELELVGTASTDDSVLDQLGIGNGLFALMVGTIEPRKNHISAVNVWTELHRRYGDECPKLVIAGRVGWSATGLCEHINLMREAGNLVHLDGLSDGELAALYRRCAFTVYLSRYEGWGLPVTESLAFGKVCVSADNSSLPEAGQGLTILVDARNERDIEEKITHLIKDPDILRGQEAEIGVRAEFKTWGAFFRELCQVGAELPVRFNPPPPVLNCDSPYWFGRCNYLDSKVWNVPGDFLRLGDSWHQSEDRGSWSNTCKSGVAFAVAEAGEYEVYLVVAAPRRRSELTLIFDGKTVWTGGLSGQKLICARLGRLNAGDEVRLTLAADSLGRHPEDRFWMRRRKVGVGWVALRLVCRKPGEAHSRSGTNTARVLEELYPSPA